jgi:eukaryotic-like serine/threonine-protein kinase
MASTAKTGEWISLRRGSYQLLAPLASSTYGEVWRAHGASGEVAVKLLHSARMREAAPELRQHWYHAANKELVFLRALSPWDERHIVRLLDDGVHQDKPVLVLELMAGDLGQYLKQQPNIEFSRCLHWVAKINQALAKVHQYGWRYLDLKPANLLLNNDASNLKLADFGTNCRARQQHGYCGTANWQAPEQFFPASHDATGPRYQTDARTDYFALGALLYYVVSKGLPLRFCSLCAEYFQRDPLEGGSQLQQAMPTGLPPTLYPDEAELFMSLIDADQERNSPSQLARAALALLRQLLAPAPAQRPPHALAIARQLDGLLALADKMQVRAESFPAQWQYRSGGLKQIVVPDLQLG